MISQFLKRPTSAHHTLARHTLVHHTLAHHRSGGLQTAHIKAPGSQPPSTWTVSMNPRKPNRPRHSISSTIMVSPVILLSHFQSKANAVLTLLRRVAYVKGMVWLICKFTSAVEGTGPPASATRSDTYYVRFYECDSGFRLGFVRKYTLDAFSHWILLGSNMISQVGGTS